MLSLKRRAGFGLVELLVVAVLLIVLGGVLMRFYFGKGEGKPGQPDRVTAMTQSRSVECQSNLRQVRMAVDLAKGAESDGKNPESLKDIRDIGQIRRCPEGGEEYRYDPQTGMVSCPHPGHEKL